MCAPDEPLSNDEKQADFTRGSATTVVSSSSSPSSSPPTPQPSSPTAPHVKPNAPASPDLTTDRVFRRQSSIAEAAKHGFHLTIGSAIAYLTILFSLYFPFVLAPRAASETYHNAFYEYDADLNHFDNTIWTYGTDYLLTVCMFVLAKNINYITPPTATPSDNRGKMMSSSSSSLFDDDLAIVGRAHHKWWSRGLLCSYMLSVLAGGLAHQFYLTPESRNSISFRILWTCCVGTVTAASGFMGAIGAELVRQDAVIRRHTNKKQVRMLPGKNCLAQEGRLDGMVIMPNLPEVFWIGFGVLATAFVIRGGFSFQDPACDIFIAGITQFPSTFYLMCIFTFGLTSMPTVQRWARIVGVVGFILNAPLLPMYPLLVQYTDWSLGTVNTLLHTWLLVAWSMQGIALRHAGQALQVAAEDLHKQDYEGSASSLLSSSPLATKVSKPKVS